MGNFRAGWLSASHWVDGDYVGNFLGRKRPISPLLVATAGESNELRFSVCRLFASVPKRDKARIRHAAA